MKKMFTLLLPALCTTAFMLAQPKEWNTVLSDQGITSLNYDGKFIWATTTYQLYRIDQDDGSINIVEMPESSRSPFSIMIDRQGTPWLMAIDNFMSGWHLYNDKGNGWIWHEVDKDLGWPTGVVFDLDNHLWIGAISGLFKYDGEFWTHFEWGNSGLPYYMVSCLAVDNNNDLWISNTNELFASNDQLVRFDGVNWVEFPMEEWKIINMIYPDYNGNVLAFCRDTIGHRNIMALKENEWRNYLDIPDEYNIEGFTIENENVFWFRSNQGVVRHENEEWTVFNRTNTPEITNNHITDILIDKNGTKWIATQAGLLAYNELGISLSDYNPYISENIEIYPNPTVDRLYIKVDESLIVNEISLFTIDGKRVQIIKGNQFDPVISLEHLMTGIYLMKVNTNDGWAVKKVIKI